MRVSLSTPLIGGKKGGKEHVALHDAVHASELSIWVLLQVVAIGSCHSNEGLKLEEVALRAEDAKLLLRGGLLGPHQNATLMLTDFPVALLQPLFRQTTHNLYLQISTYPFHASSNLLCICTSSANVSQCILQLKLLMETRQAHAMLLGP